MMKTIVPIALRLIAVCAATAATLVLPGCDKKAEPAKSPAADSAAKPHDDHDHAAGDGHDHGAKKPDGQDHADDHGPTTELGEQSAGGFAVKASRDGEIKPGSDAPIDAWITGGAAKVSVVRFWIGAADAKGSVKAKAEIEKDNWHTHVEIPSPLPAGSKLWVEIETDKGEKSVVGFDLKN